MNRDELESAIADLQSMQDVLGLISNDSESSVKSWAFSSSIRIGEIVNSLNKLHVYYNTKPVAVAHKEDF